MQLAAAVSAYAIEFSNMLAGFFVATGVPGDVAAAALREAGERARSGKAELLMPVDQLWVQLSDTIVMWWRDPDYLDDQGSPLDLPEAGPAPSLDALLSRTVDDPLRSRAKDLLKKTAAIECEGLWRLRKRDGSLPLGGGIESVERLHLILSGILRTFVDNQTRLDEPPILKNLDAAAHVRAFPVNMIPELRAKLHKRMRVVLDDIDIWMTATAMRNTAGPVTLVGVSAHMYTSQARDAHLAHDALCASDSSSDAAPAQTSSSRGAARANLK
jgi:hypothetical protein